MMPPICSFCADRFDTFGTKGELLHFKITDAQQASNARMKNLPHHPEGAHWFCEDHINAAKALTHLEIRDALAEMKASLNPQT